MSGYRRDFAELVQGEVIQLEHLPLLTSAVSPHTDLGKALMENAPPAGGTVRVAAKNVDSSLVMIVSQTCDLQPRRNPNVDGGTGEVLPEWVQVAPVVWVAESDRIAKEAQKRLTPGRLHAPWVEGGNGRAAIVLLAETTSIDAGVLHTCRSVAQPSSEERWDLARLLGRFWSRAALSDEYVTAIGPWVKAVRSGRPQSLRKVLEEHVEQVRIVVTGPEVDANACRLILVPYRSSYPDGDSGSSAAPPSSQLALDTAAQQLLKCLEEIDPARPDSRTVRTRWAEFANAIELKCNQAATSNSECRVSVAIAEMDRGLYENSIEADLTHISI